MKKETFLSAKGRLRRRDYLTRAILLAIPTAFMSWISDTTYDTGLLALTSFIMLVCGVLLAIQAIKRLHDINMSGWNWLIFLIPVINLFFGLYVIFKDGTPGTNKYGDDPKGRVISGI